MLMWGALRTFVNAAFKLQLTGLFLVLLHKNVHHSIVLKNLHDLGLILLNTILLSAFFVALRISSFQIYIYIL